MGFFLRKMMLLPEASNCRPETGSGSRSETHVWKRGRASDVVLFPKCFHLYDRTVKPRVIHDERFTVPKISAVLKLCIQVGVDLDKFPSKRRSRFWCKILLLKILSYDFGSVWFGNAVKNGGSNSTSSKEDNSKAKANNAARVPKPTILAQVLTPMSSARVSSLLLRLGCRARWLSSGRVCRAHSARVCSSKPILAAQLGYDGFGLSARLKFFI